MYPLPDRGRLARSEGSSHDGGHCWRVRAQQTGVHNSPTRTATGLPHDNPGWYLVIHRHGVTAHLR